MVATSKSLSIDQRLGVWQATLSMIRDHPLGVGADKFQYSVTPYKEKNIILTKFKEDVNNPHYYEENIERAAHNDYLNTLAEEGIIFVSLLILVFVQMMRERWKAISWKHPATILVLSYSVFMGVEAFFQFPASTPYPFFVTAIMVGVFLYQLYGEQSTALHKGFLAPILSLFLVAYAGIGYAHYVLSVHPNSSDHLLNACRLTPLNGRVCMAAANRLMKSENFKVAEELLLNQGRLFPNNFFAQRHLIRLYYLTGEEKKFCHYVHSYDSLFKHKSTFREAATYCQ